MQHVFDTSCVDRVMHWMAYSSMVVKIFSAISLCVFCNWSMAFAYAIWVWLLVCLRI
jgi:hypothetical protein